MVFVLPNSKTLLSLGAFAATVPSSAMVESVLPGTNVAIGVIIELEINSVFDGLFLVASVSKHFVV